MNRLIRITKPEDVFPQYRNTPISMLLEYHNLNREFETYSQAQMLISMCMDNSLPILVFNLTKKGNIKRAVWGETIGTIVS